MKSSFVISMMILLDVVDGHGIFLVGWSLCSKFFFPFVDNDSPCGSLELQSLTNGFVTLFRLMDVNDSGMISWFNSSGTNQAWVRPLKLNSEVYWGYLCIILKCVWWSKTSTCNQCAKNEEIRKEATTFQCCIIVIRCVFCQLLH